MAAVFGDDDDDLFTRELKDDDPGNRRRRKHANAFGTTGKEINPTLTLPDISSTRLQPTN